jgi:hypothetical protein
MEKLPIGQAAKEVIEIPTSIAPIEPQGGVPWGGIGIGVVVIAALVFAKKKFCSK